MESVDNHNILVLNDDPKQRAALERLLTEAGYNVKTTNSAKQAIELLNDGIDCVVTGVISGELARVDLIKHWKNYFPDTPLPVIHETESVASLVEKMQAEGLGPLNDLDDAHQVLTKLMQLVQACQKDATAKIIPEIDGLEDYIIGRTPVMRDLFHIIARSSQVFSTVLILGETGTGKDLVAHAIHRHSSRHTGPFIAMNCAAIPEGLIESELFGFEKGSFTGAVGVRTGKFEAANGGTLFIDEVGDCSLAMQSKLLRILEDRVVTPLGGHRKIKVDTRIIAATSRNLPEMVAKGLFREDLYFRLNIITITAPPLRNRVEDIPLLVRFCITQVNEKSKSNVVSISVSALDSLRRYAWPGNVRQLFNVIERTMVLADRSKTVLTLDDFPAEIAYASAGMAPALASATASAEYAGKAVALAPKAAKKPTASDAEPLLTLDEIEKNAIAEALKRYGNNKTRAAHAIGISVRTLQRKIAEREEAALVLLRTDKLSELLDA